MNHVYDEATLDLLRLTIPTYGIIVPIILRSGTNEVIDGRHRMKIREELLSEGMKITLPVHHVDTDNPAEIDQIVNSVRRPWQDAAQRQELVRKLRERGHSNQCIADAIGTNEKTVRRDLAQTPTPANADVGVSEPESATPANAEIAVSVPQATTGKDGKDRKPPAAPEEIASAWSMKDSGMSTPAIAFDLGRGEQTVRNWFKKSRPEALQAVQPVMAAPSAESPPLELTPPSSTPKPQRPTVPDSLKQAHQREQKRIRERWQPIAEHLRAAHDLIRAEKERLCREYAGAHGSLIMQRRWQQMAEIWAESGLLGHFAEITGEPEAVTLDGLLSELERSSRMANNWIKSVAVYTGCRPDPTRHQPERSQ